MLGDVTINLHVGRLKISSSENYSLPLKLHYFLFTRLRDNKTVISLIQIIRLTQARKQTL